MITILRTKEGASIPLDGPGPSFQDVEESNRIARELLSSGLPCGIASIRIDKHVDVPVIVYSAENGIVAVAEEFLAVVDDLDHVTQILPRVMPTQ